jgi:hypothetical protein
VITFGRAQGTKAFGSYAVEEMRNEVRRRLELALPRGGFTIDA